MNCKNVHSKLIFFLEKELPVSEMKQVQEHLNQCSECALFYKELQSTFSILENDKITDENPFFYTRVKARLEEQSPERRATNSVFVRILQPVAFSVILLLGIYGGVKLGQPHKAEVNSEPMAKSEVIPYLNGMEAEPIENFLMQ